MELPLVVGVDGSNGSLLAVDWAVDEAARYGLPLRLVYASLWERHEGAVPSNSPERPGERVRADHVLASAAERARRRNPDLEVCTEAVLAEAVSALLSESHHAFALVTGSRGRGELKGMLLGSVGLAVTARAHCPVVVVRGDGPGLAGAHNRVLLGAGDPGTCGEAVRFAFREAGVRGCVLDVVRTGRWPAREALEHPERARESDHRHEQQASAVLDALIAEEAVARPDVRVQRATVEGPARKVLVHRSAAADLVVVGARRRTGPFGLQLGRVSHTLLHHAACPVAVVPERD
ncbi:universal stress protein [Streptomyces sp. TRM S81-3]|uniref:Universal stress protein n=1 Tax=Streptomyces griseicoloratus TaxID=2752516 RepID=A0A926L9V5_9ACTN|nr:universal stress protein [Streptomyces griseicoloratus]MBD0422718.1 universal stress protein [Streptomyces griseicoloratus]